MGCPLISIIVACLDARPALELTLQGLDEVEVDYSVEWLVVDGASSDDTPAMLADLETRYCGRLRFVSEPDSGVYDAYNKGANLARGEYLFFLGAGDSIRKGALPIIARSFSRRPEVVYADVFSSKRGVRVGGEFSPQLVAQSFMWHQGIFYHREVFSRCGGYRERYPVYADADFNIRAFGLVDIPWRYVDCVVTDYLGGGLSDTARDSSFSDEVGETIQESLGESAAIAFCNSGFELELYLRNHPDATLAIVVEEAWREAAEFAMARFSARFDGYWHFRTICMAFEGSWAERLLLRFKSSELEGIDAVVVFTTRPCLSIFSDDVDAKQLRLLRGVYLRHRVECFDQLLSGEWNGCYVFGAGEAGIALSRQLAMAFNERDLAFPVKGFFDNDSTKWGMVLDGLPVLEPQLSVLGDCDGVLIVSDAWREITAQLVADGLNAERFRVAI